MLPQYFCLRYYISVVPILFFGMNRVLLISSNVTEGDNLNNRGWSVSDTSGM